jgi:hypothetical protein
MRDDTVAFRPWNSPPVRYAIIVGLCVFNLVLPVRLAALDQPSLQSLLDHAASYVEHFEREFSVILSDEEYRQTESSDGPTQPARPTDVIPLNHERRLDLRSEMLFMWVVQDRSWISVRNVLRVGRKPIADSKDRLERVLTAQGPVPGTQLRQLAAENARFNLGFYHDYNNPTLALQFLSPELQRRFTFTLAGQERIDGIVTWKIAFEERVQPTVIVSDGENLFSTGSLWLSASDAVVVRTLLTLRVPATRTKVGMNGSVVVDYRRNAKLALWVPSRMEERYEQIGGINDSLHCIATYSNFRRFETSSRILP